MTSQPVASTSGSTPAQNGVNAASTTAMDVDKPIESASNGTDPSAANAATPEPSAQVMAWRKRQLDEKQKELAQIVDKHDDHVRELFHLDRFVTLIGFDPAVAKQDKSDVFLSFQHQFDLFQHATADDAAVTGRRATRRAATERKGVLASPVLDKGKGKAKVKVEEESQPSLASSSKAAPRKSATGAAPKATKVAQSKAVKGKAENAKGSTTKRTSASPPKSPTRASQANGAAVIAATLKHVLDSKPEPARKRIKVEADTKSLTPVYYSHPRQLPEPPAHGSLRKLYTSYSAVINEAGGPVPEESAIEQQAKYEASILRRVAILESDGHKLENPDRTVSVEYKREKDHQEHLVEQALYFSKLVNEERKSHVALAKRTARMIMGHFERLKTKDERQAKELLSLQKNLAKWTAKQVKAKWRLAINVVRAKFKAERQAERERIGKQQLNLMLDKSTTMLQQQQTEMIAEESDQSGESSSEEDSSSADEEDGSDDGVTDSAAGAASTADLDDAPDSEQATSDAGTPVSSDAPSSSVRESSPLRPRRAMRSRSTLSISTSAADVEAEPDADDQVFAVEDDDEERANEDEAMEYEMEAEDAEGAAAEDDDDDALAREAEMPLDELLKVSGYAAMVASTSAPSPPPTAGKEEEPLDVSKEEEEAEAMSEFGSDADEAIKAEDDDLEEAMKAEEAEAAADDSEMDDLAAEAELPIDELMQKYGYAPNPAAAQAMPKAETKEEQPELTKEEQEAEAMSEFDSDADEARAAEDEDLLEAMEKEEAEAGSDDSEMDGLAAEAEMPIEELMKRYGYGANQGEREASSTAPDEALTNEDAVAPQSSATSPESAEPKQDDEASDAEASEEAEEEAEPAQEDAALQKVRLRPPFLLRGNLRPYQQAGLEWLASLYSSGVNGILADEMGLGKTIQTISLLAHLACDRGIWGPHLVIVPTSVMLNWEMEFKKFLPGFKLITYYGTQKERKEKRKGWNTDNAFHVCVTSYQIVLSDQAMFRRKPWHYMILDEAHHIKNFRSQRWQTLLGFNARHRLLLTGTPLQNNLMELWSLLYFLMPPGLFPQDGKGGPFADHSEFQSWFSNPMEKAIESGQTMDAETQQTVNKLHTILRPYLLRRLKAEVETQMPGKTESVIYCRMSKRQRFLYDEFMSRASTRETLGSGQFLSIINCLMQLRKVCNHPDLFEVRPILTSFSMTRSVADVYEPTELLVRKRLLAEEPVAKMDWTNLRLVKHDEHERSGTASKLAVKRDASRSFIQLLPQVAGVDLSRAAPLNDTKTVAGWRKWLAWHEQNATKQRLSRTAQVNTQRCRNSVPYYGSEVIRLLQTPSRSHPLSKESLNFSPRKYFDHSSHLPSMVQSYQKRSVDLDPIVRAYACITPNAKAPGTQQHALEPLSEEQVLECETQSSTELLHTASTKLSIAFPDKSLLQYDCGKLQKLDELLRECKAGGHRALIFTQMTKVLDILEEFLSFHGHRYLRLDGSTKVEQRQTLTERFNSNDKILCFISSTRAGGLGINLQGADTVIFYDSDWNPALDRQCQDRAHRIGQTREVRIWRLVTEHSIEENMLRKANQKRRLDEMVIAEGDFTTDYLQKLDWRDYLDDKQLDDLGVSHDDEQAQTEGAGSTTKESAAEIRQALAAAEDAEDAAAARAAEGELQLDQSDFNEQPVQPSVDATRSASASATPQAIGTPMAMQVEAVGAAEEDPLAGTVDGYMCRFVEENWDLFA